MKLSYLSQTDDGALSLLQEAVRLSLGSLPPLLLRRVEVGPLGRQLPAFVRAVLHHRLLLLQQGVLAEHRRTSEAVEDELMFGSLRLIERLIDRRLHLCPFQLLPFDADLHAEGASLLLQASLGGFGLGQLCRRPPAFLKEANKKPIYFNLINYSSDN